MKILVFDNYDSFTYNLVHLVEKISGQQVSVYRNDEISLAEVDAFDKIILSPGPGIPKEAGLLLPLIQKNAPQKSILGVCLGHQAIAEAFGARLSNLNEVYHGVASRVSKTAQHSYLFNGLNPSFEVGRYHSWIIEESSLPDEFEVTARDEQGVIMAIQHTEYDLQGVQFHPESVLTPDGEQIIRNWLLK